QSDFVFERLQGDVDVQPTFTLNSRGTLTVTGTPNDDVISVSLRTRDNRFIARVGAFSHAFPTLKVNRIVAYRGFGKDAVTIDPRLLISAYVEGGDGSDTITGGSGNDVLLGNAGNHR